MSPAWRHPAKGRVIFDGAGHRAHFDQPGRFAQVMADVRAAVGTGIGDKDSEALRSG